MRLPATLLALGLASFTGSPAFGGWAWNSDGTLELRSGYDGNLRLNEIDLIDTPLYRARTSWAFDATNAKTTFGLVANATQVEYPGLDADVDTDFGAVGNWRYSAETWFVNASIGRQRVNTLANAIEDTGLPDNTVQRDADTRSLGATWQLTEQAAVGLRTSLQDFRYLDDSNFSDFEFETYTGEFSWQSSQQMTWIFAADTTEFDTDNNISQSSTVGASVGFRRQHSETLESSVSVGRNWIDTESRVFFGPFFFIDESSSADFRLDAELRKRWLTNDLTFTAGQQVQPAGNGILTTRRYWSASWRHRFSERLSLRLATLHRDFDEVNSTGVRENDRTAARYSAALDFLWSPSWSWRFEASHRTQAFDLRADEARGDSVYLSLTYRFHQENS